MIIDYLQKV